MNRTNWLGAVPGNFRVEVIDSPAGHAFRHHFSQAWLDHGGAEGDLMELNGWASPQMLRRYGASARSARARRSYDRVMEGTP